MRRPAVSSTSPVSVSAVAGLAIGALFFWTMKVQVDYVVKRQGAAWLLPALLYARLALVALILIAIATSVSNEDIPCVLVAGLAGMMVARVLVSRRVKRDLPEDGPLDSDSGNNDDADRH